MNVIFCARHLSSYSFTQIQPPLFSGHFLQESKTLIFSCSSAFSFSSSSLVFLFYLLWKPYFKTVFVFYFLVFAISQKIKIIIALHDLLPFFQKQMRFVLGDYLNSDICLKRFSSRSCWINISSCCNGRILL